MIDPDPDGPCAGPRRGAQRSQCRSCEDAARSTCTPSSRDCRPGWQTRRRRRATPCDCRRSWWSGPGPGRPRPDLAVAPYAPRSICSSRPSRSTPSRTPTWANAGRMPWLEYDGDAGDSLRFGDGVFGELTTPGHSSRSRTARRPAPSATSRQTPSRSSATTWRASCCRSPTPSPAAGGGDRETIRRHPRQRPHAFRAGSSAPSAPRTTGDREGAAVGAGCRHQVRWTGELDDACSRPPSPPTRRGAVDRRDVQLIELLDRRRLAGYECTRPRHATSGSTSS